MNPPQIPGPPAQTPGPATIPLVRRGIPRPMVLLIALFLVVVIAFSLCAHRENSYEKLTHRVIEAVQRNDMAPVANDFNALTRAKLTRTSVARFSDQLAPLGKLKSVQENTPKDAAAGRHTFALHFEKGDRTATMVLDQDGKIAAFRVPEPS